MVLRLQPLKHALGEQLHIEIDLFDGLPAEPRKSKQIVD
jgi:hypothetical protein